MFFRTLCTLIKHEMNRHFIAKARETINPKAKTQREVGQRHKNLTKLFLTPFFSCLFQVEV